jgi:anti-sigma-K factor RskA
MIDESQQETASLYVLELLMPHEALAFEKRVEADSELRLLVSGLAETTAALALDAPVRVPPASLKNRIMAQIEAERRENLTPKVRGTPQIEIMEAPKATRSIIQISSWLPWGIAAALAVYGGLLQTKERQKGQIDALERENAMSKMTISMLSSQYPGAQNASGVVVWDAEKQEGVLTFEQLPPQDPDKDYQIWVVDPKYKQPVNGGVFGVSKEGGVSKVSFKAEEPVSKVKLFAISLEKKGGVPKAEGPMVLVSKNPLE